MHGSIDLNRGHSTLKKNSQVVYQQTKEVTTTGSEFGSSLAGTKTEKNFFTPPGQFQYTLWLSLFRCDIPPSNL